MSLIDSVARMFSSRAKSSAREEPSNIPVPGGRLAGRESLGTINKGSSVGPLIAYHNLGEPVWAPRDYSAFAREGFMQNAIV